MKRLSSWGWIPVVVLLAAVPLGFHFLDRGAADVATQSGMAAINSKQYSQAIDHFNRAIQIAPKYAPAYHGRGVAYFHQGEWHRAIADFTHAIQLDPSDARSRYDRGVACCRVENYDGALTDFGEAIRLNPEYARAYRARGWVYGKKGDAARARVDRQKAAELDPAGKADDGDSGPATAPAFPITLRSLTRPGNHSG